MKTTEKRDVSRGVCGNKDCGHWQDEHKQVLFGAECHGKSLDPYDNKAKCKCTGFVFKAAKP